MFQKVRKFATTKKQIGQNRAKFRLFETLSHFGSPVRVALFDVTISNCCSKGIIGGIISFRDKQCIINYNQNNSFADNTLALGAQKNVKQLIKDGKVILSIGEISTSEQRVDIYIKMTCFGKTILEQSYSGLTTDFLICK